MARNLHFYFFVINFIEMAIFLIRSSAVREFVAVSMNAKSLFTTQDSGNKIKKIKRGRERRRSMGEALGVSKFYFALNSRIDKLIFE